MRTLAAAIALIAASAQAQPTVGPQVIWRTTSAATTYKPVPQAARIVADGDGFVVTWSEVSGGLSRACAGSLDAAGHLVAVGVCTSGAADGASVAPLGDRYLAAWIEPEFGDARPLLVTAALDRNFALLKADVVGLTVSPPIVRTNGARALLASGSFLYELDPEGVITKTYPLAQPLDDLALANGEAALVWHIRRTFGVYDLGFIWLFRQTTGVRVFLDSDAPVGVGMNGQRALVVWAEPHVLKASLLGTAFNQFVVSTKGPDLLPGVQPQVAWDGQRWLVVWRAQDALMAAEIAPDLSSIRQLTIGADGTRPAVAALHPGRFLVTYEIVEGNERRLASRVMEFEPPAPGRGRAVH